jgi:hypothetical protein
MERLGTHLSLDTDLEAHPIRIPALGTVGRNLVFLVIILCHGVRRLVPPY